MGSRRTELASVNSRVSSDGQSSHGAGFSGRVSSDGQPSHGAGFSQ